MNKRTEKNTTPESRSTKAKTARFTRKADVLRMAGSEKLPVAMPKFSSASMYEIRIAEGLDLASKTNLTPSLETYPADAGTGKVRFRRARVERSAGFVFPHIDHTRHIVYFVKIDDNLEEMANLATKKESQ